MAVVSVNRTRALSLKQNDYSTFGPYWAVLERRLEETTGVNTPMNDSTDTNIKKIIYII
jgi:hypothetical protein